MALARVLMLECCLPASRLFARGHLGLHHHTFLVRVTLCLARYLG